MCGLHYQRAWRHGNAEIVLRASSRTVHLDGAQMRSCRVCSLVLPTSEFHRKKDGYASACKQCRKAELQDLEKKKAANAAWRASNKVAIAAKKKTDYESLRDSLREEWLTAYGRKCECCGESNWKFLTIEHANGDGKSHREQVGTGVFMLKSMRREGWPRDRYQLLCFNCNSGKARNGGICPHKEP